nr:MAG TPA: tail tape measure [Caudoviricetes sp.]
MSKTIDQRVVEMRFDNANFEKNVSTSMSTLDKLKKSLKFEDSAKGFENISKAAGRVDMGGLSSGVESVRLKFSALEVMAVTALQNITNSALNAGKKIAYALTIEPIKSGLQEYETQINATQTILANTQKEGANINDVNRALNELNKYADLTIYNFTEMTRNIGTFTAAGVDLNTSVNAIKGIANLAAVSGSTSQQASTAMYQLSQALASGTVKLQDWNSVVNANMGGQAFQDALKMTARIHGIAIDEMIADEGSFRETLSKGWLTKDILTETLQHFTEFTDTYNEESLKRQGYNDKEIAEIKQMGITATDAATKIKTFSQLWDVLKESAQSGWTTSWQTIIGDFEEAKETLTVFGDTLTKMIGDSADARNAVLKEGFMSGWKQLLNEGIEDTEGFQNTIIEAGKNSGVAVDDLIKKYGSFEKSLKGGWVTSDMLKTALDSMAASVAGLSKEELEAKGYTEDQRQALLNLVEAVKDGSLNLDEFAKKMGRASGRENMIDAITMAFEKLMPIVNQVGDAFQEVFNPNNDLGQRIYDMTARIREFVDGIEVSEKGLQNFKMSIEGILSIFHIAGKGVSAFAQIIRHLLGKLLPVGDGILDMTGSLGEFLVSVDKAIDSGGYLEKFVELVNGAIDKLASGFKVAKDYVLDFIGSWTGIDFSKFESLRDIFALIGEKLSEFGEKIRDTFPWVNSLKETVTAAFQKIRGSADEDLGAANTALESLKTAGSKVKEVFSNIAEKIGAFFAPVVEKIKSIFSGVTITDLIGTGLLAGIFKSIKKFADAFSDLLENFKGIGESISGVLDSARDALVLWQKDIKANILLKIAGAVGILAAALWVISKVDADRVLGSMGAITALLAEVTAVMAGIMKWGTSANALEGLSEAAQLGKIATAMMVIAGAVLILAAALKKCENLNWDNTIPAMTALFVLLGEMTGAMYGFMAIAKKNPLSKETGTLQSFAVGMIGMSVAIAILASAVARLGELDREQVVQGGLTVVALMAALGGVTAALKAIKSDNMSGVAGSMIAMALALTMLYVPIRLFAKLDTETLKQGGIAVGVALLAMTSAMTVMKSAKGDLKGVAGSLLAMATALMLLIVPIKVLGGMDMNSLAKGLIGILVPLAAMGAVLSGLSGGDYSGIGTNMIAMAAAMTLLVIPLKVLGSMDLASLAKGLGAFVIALAALVGAAYLIAPLASSLGGLSKAMLAFGAACLGVGVLVGAIAFAFMTLATIGAAGVAAILAAITGLIQGFRVMMPIIGEALKDLILTLCDVLKDTAPAITETALYLIDELLRQIEEYVPSIVAHLAKIIQKIGQAITENFGEIGLGDWVGAAIFAGIVAASALLVKGFAAVSKDVPKALIGAAGVAAILVIVGGVIAAMTLLDLDSVMGIAASLSAVLLSLSVMIGVLGMMPLTAGLAAGLVLAEFIAVMAAIMAALGGLNQIPGFSWLMDEGIKVLGQIGEGIGTFVGSIVGAAIERITAGIAESGNNLSLFMENLQPFLDGARNIDQAVLDGIIKLTECMLLISAAEIVDAIAGWLTGGSSLKDFGEELAEFGPSFATFADSVSGVDTAAVKASGEALKAITEAASSIPNEGGVLSWIVGDNSLADFAEGLVPFGEALMAYGEAVAGIQKYLTHIRLSAKAAEYIIEIADIVPNSGGLAGLIVGNNDLKDFAEGLKPFGEALMEYGKAVTGIGDYTDDIKQSVKSAKEIVKVGEIIPNSGGLVGLIVGNNDLKDFAKGLKPFGEALVDYGTAVNGIGEKSADISASVAAAKDIVSLATEVKGAANAKNLKKTGEGLIEFATQIKNFMAECEGLNAGQLDSLKTALQSIVDIASSFSTIDTSALTEFVQSMETIGSASVDEFLSSFSDSKATAATAANALIANLKSAIGTSESQLKSKFEEAAKKGLEGLTSKKSDFKTAGEDLMKSFNSGVSSQTSTVKNQFSTLLSNCVAAVRSYYSQFQSAGSYLAAGIANGISANAGAVTNASASMASRASSAARSKLQIKSPSRVGYQIGDYFGIGFTNGITDNIRNAGISSDALAESATTGLSNAVSKIASLIDSGMDMNPTIRPVLDLTEIQNGSAAMADLMSTLSGRPVEGTVSIAAKTANSMNRTAFAPEQQTEATGGKQTSENTTNNFYITGADPRAIADEVDRKLQRRVERKKAAWA